MHPIGDLFDFLKKEKKNCPNYSKIKWSSSEPLFDPSNEVYLDVPLSWFILRKIYKRKWCNLIYYLVAVRKTIYSYLLNVQLLCHTATENSDPIEQKRFLHAHLRVHASYNNGDQSSQKNKTKFIDCRYIQYSFKYGETLKCFSNR